MRIDIYLYENGFASSRTDAKQKITEGLVSVNGTVVTKPSFDVDGEVEITVAEGSNKYASRGGFKLEGALDAFKVDPSGALAIDIGASSGGFTDCLLQRGAEKVKDDVFLVWLVIGKKTL